MTAIVLLIKTLMTLAIFFAAIASAGILMGGFATPETPATCDAAVRGSCLFMIF